jgi:hypothetical protein
VGQNPLCIQFFLDGTWVPNAGKVSHKLALIRPTTSPREIPGKEYGGTGRMRRFGGTIVS